VICDSWDVVVVPFPFTERAGQKRRPALVLSGSQAFNQHGHSVMAMITSSTLPWALDTPLKEHALAGLSATCAVRLKLFTLDNRLIIRRIGRLSGEDQNGVASALKTMLPF